MEHGVRRIVLSILGALLLAFVTGCLGAKQTWSAQPVSTAEVRITPQEVYRRKDRLFVRATVTNLTNENITIDRDGISLQLEGGPLLGRSTGMTTLHNVYTLPPNAAHSVYVDFRDELIDESTAGASVVWRGAVHAGRRELAIPPTPVRAR
jgi:hypothetical protein